MSLGFSEMLWLSRVLEGPADFTDSAPPPPVSQDDARDAPQPSPPPAPTEDPEDTAPPPKKSKTTKGKAATSQGSLHSKDTFRPKYPTRRSQGLSSTPIDVESHSFGPSASKFFSELVLAKDCDRLINLSPDQQQHQATSYFAQVGLPFIRFCYSSYFFV